MEHTISQRLTELIRFLGENQVSFSKKTGVPQSSIATIAARGTGVSSHIIEKIHIAFPILSLEWFITGEGAMLKSDGADTTVNTQEDGTPLLPVEAWGGSLNGSSIAILAEQCKKYNVPISNIDYLIPIAGDSMMPDYCPGDVVAIKKVNEKAFIEWGKVYVLDTCNGVVIKEVQPSENEGCITCVSRNTPTKYKPFEINLCPDNFFGMYAVKGTVRIS